MKTGMGNSRLPGCIELSVPAVKITSMTDPILISDLRYFATPSALARATVFAEGVSVLDLEDLKRPGSWVQGLVPSNPLHIVELETTWPGRFVCTCGAQSWSPGATEHLCEHAAAVLVRSLTSSTEDPRGALEELRDDADLAVALGTAWAELVQRAVRRDAEGSVPLNRLRDIAEWSGVHVSLRQAGLSVAAWASPEQLERFLLHEVEWHLGEDGEGDLSPQSSAIHEVADLLCWGEMPAVAATVPARLAAARRVRSALGPETSAEDMLRWRYLSLLRLGGVSAEPRREERLRLAREVVALEERHRSPRRPLGPDLVRTWDEDMRAAGLEEARRRIDSLLRLIDEEGGDEIVPGDGARDPLLLAYDEGSIVAEHRFPDAGRPVAQPIRERLQRLWRVVADLAVELRDPGTVLLALRSMKDPPLGEYFHRARGWSVDLQSEIALVAHVRGRIEWGTEHDQGSTMIGAEEAIGALSAAGRSDEARELLIRLLGKDPDPSRTGDLIRCWRRAALVGDPVEAMRDLLGGRPPNAPRDRQIPVGSDAPG